MCDHTPLCPGATDSDRDAARVIASHPEQGWSLLCNGVITFDDSGTLMPNGTAVEPCALPAPSPIESEVML
jgi:hypothetical protein